MSSTYAHLYIFLPTAVPRVIALERNISSSFTTLTCTSTGSPPTTVTWTKDGVTLPTDETIYSFTQTLVDRATSTYNNTLTIDASFVDVIGNYSCSVSNSIGTSSVQETEIKGMSSNTWDNLQFLAISFHLFSLQLCRYMAMKNPSFLVCRRRSTASPTWMLPRLSGFVRELTIGLWSNHTTTSN